MVAEGTLRGTGDGGELLRDGLDGDLGRALSGGVPAYAVHNQEDAGRFGGSSGTPSSPLIASFTASPVTVQPGQSVTLNWSVAMGAGPVK